MLSSLGQLYVRGAKVNWSGLDQANARKVALPTYPFQRQRYWIEPPAHSRPKSTVLEGTTEIVNRLNEGQTEALAQQLEEVGEFSPEQLEALPHILRVLTQQHQKQLVTSTLKHWLYQVQWVPASDPPPPPTHQPSHWLIFCRCRWCGGSIGQQTPTARPSV